MMKLAMRIIILTLTLLTAQCSCYIVLQVNWLTEFPDVRSIASTLVKLYLYHNKIEVIDQTLLSPLVNIQSLNLKYNPLKVLPDFSDVGASSASFKILHINNIWVHSDTICEFHTLVMGYDSLHGVPYIDCKDKQSAELETLYLQSNDYTARTDFSNLTAIAHPGFSSLYIDYNEFAENFPDLPIELRQTIKHLVIKHSHMTYISADRLANYSLNLLNLSYNALDAVPMETFHIAQQLSLSSNPWQNFTSTYWHEALCDGQNLHRLEMSHNMPHLAYMHILLNILCTRDGVFSLYLHRINAPCDCTVAWIQQARSCDVNIFLDHLPCQSAKWDKLDTLLNCPQSFAVLVASNQTELVENTLSSVNVSASLVYVHETMCAVSASSGDMIILGPGSHVFSDGINISDVLLFTNNAKIDEAVLPVVTCQGKAPTSAPDTALVSSAGFVDITVSTSTSIPVTLITDGSRSTCLSVQHAVHFLTVTSHSPIQHTQWAYISVTTRHMDCRHPFHVAIVNRIPCSPSPWCTLVNEGRVVHDGGFTVCRFQCDHGDGEWEIRLAHVDYGEICDVVLEP